MSFIFAHGLRVRFRDCDPMGHVNHAVYFTYMEQARFEFLRERFPGDEFGSLSIILARAECDFRSQAHFGDRLDIRVRVAGVGRSSFALEYEIVASNDGRLVAAGRTVQVAFDYKAQRSQALPGELRAQLEGLAASATPE